METPRHQRLKALAAAYLRASGCAALALEVRCPASRYRVDAAGYADPLPRGDGLRAGTGSLRLPGRANTVLIECKQSRSDFLRDSRHLDSLLARRAELDRRRQALEDRLIRVSEPHLICSGSMLFPEMETWDFASSRSPGYRAVQRELRAINRQIHGDTKFWSIARYALADMLLIAAPRGLIRVAELPPGWGLLEFTPEWIDVALPRDLAPADAGPPVFGEPLAFRLRIAAPSRAATLTREAHRVRLLRNIAAAATAAAGPHRPYLAAIAAARRRDPLLYPHSDDAAADHDIAGNAGTPGSSAPVRDRGRDPSSPGDRALRPDRVG